MKVSGSSVLRLTTLLVMLLAPIMGHAQQTIVASAGQVGVAYSYQVTSNATPPVQYTASNLPDGLAINATSGLITGTPTTSGTTIGTVSVTSGGQTNSASISISIAAAAGTPVITSPASANGTVGVPFSYSVVATNSPVSYNITGLPSGLTANTTTGVISGTPATAGTSSVSLSANNASGTGAAVTITLAIAAPAEAPAIGSASTASVAVGAPFSYTITATNTPTSFAASGLPVGLSLDTATGAITGTPTVAGVYAIGLTASNSSGSSAPFSLSLTVGALSEITSSTSATAAVGVPFTYATTANPAATSFNISGLPAGLAANTSTGVISGTPIAASVGVSSVNLSANNATGVGPVTTLTLTVGYLPVVANGSASGTAGAPFSYTLTASNSPTAFAATGLPAGLTLDPVSGTITGTPASAGTSSVSVTATNAFGTSTAATLTISVGASGGGSGGGGGGGPGGANIPKITSPAFYGAEVNQAFTFTVTSSPAATLYTSVDLPDGVSLDISTGVLSGKLTAMGSYSFLVRASNSAGTETQSFELTIGTRPTISRGPDGGSVQVGGAVTLEVAGTGSPVPTYQWRKNGSVIAGATAASLSLTDFQVEDAGAYNVTLTNAVGSATSETVLLGVSSASKFEGHGEVAGTDIVHPNGNVYDQILLTGDAATITADTGQVTRISFIDLDDDIVQVEFTGAGTLALSLENASGPAAPVKYEQPGIKYMKGHASLVITGADETSNVSVFSVGPVTAVNQSLFKAGETYDGIADIGAISITSRNGKFGGIRTANAAYFRNVGITGVFAPSVAIVGPVYLGEITADDSATPAIILGSSADVRITGGELLQLNHRAVQVDGIARLTFASGTTSTGILLPVQTNKAKIEQHGVDVTDQLVDTHD